jgi:uncharacterized membrane protein
MSKKELTIEEQIQVGKLKQRNRVINFMEGIILMAFGLWTAVAIKTYNIDHIAYLLSVFLIIIGVLSVLSD